MSGLEGKGKDRGAWTTVSSRIVYRNPWITVHEDQVIHPNGHPGTFGVVESGGAVGVVAVTDHDEIFLVGQHRYPARNYSWELPGGGIEKGELPLAAAKRELAEEAGVQSDDWRELGGKVYTSNCVMTETAHFFLARGLRPAPKKQDELEDLEIQTLPYAEALRLIDAGEISEAMTIIALLRYDRLRRGLGR